MTREEAISRAKELTLAMWWTDQTPDWANITKQLELMASIPNEPAEVRAEIHEVINQLP